MKVVQFFETEIPCDGTKNCLEKIVANLTENHFVPLMTLNDSKQTSWRGFGVIRSNWFFYNSFLPDVYIKELSTLQKRKIVLRFALKKSVQIIISAYSCLCLAMEIILLVSTILGKISMTPIAFLPMLFILYVYLLSIIIHRLCSKRLLQQIKLDISGVYTEKLKLHLVWYES